MTRTAQTSCGGCRAAEVNGCSLEHSGNRPVRRRGREDRPALDREWTSHGLSNGPRLVRLDPVEVRALGRPIHKPSLTMTAESPADEGGVQGSDPLSEDPATQLGDYIRRLVDAAPPLTDAQRSRLALLLRGAA